MKFVIIFAACFVAAIANPVVPLLKHEEIHTDRGYKVEYHTGDGIKVLTEGTHVEGPEGDIVRVVGSYEYQSPEGVPIRVTYLADENGFHPSGEHLPK